MMPQGRKKIAFSGKAKKQQMQNKNQRKTNIFLTGKNQEFNELERDIKKINKQPKDNAGKNKYALQFFEETKEELQKRREEARNVIEACDIEDQEVSDDYFPDYIDMPKRPTWDFAMNKEELDMREHKYFLEYLKKLETIRKISYFELNLETWRQLWRVIEMSDILLIIADIRYPVMMFPPYLYNYVTNDLGKDMILILNKVDLAPSALIVAWQEYFKNKYPKLHILVFTSFPTYNLKENINQEANVKIRRKGKLKMAAEGAQKIMETCKNIVGDQVDLSRWAKKIQEEMQSECDMNDLERNDNVVIEKKDTGYFEHEKYKNGVLTIGCVGTPNVGKSSLINALMGKKVVSVSRTPGHTKHFQTIFLTKNVCLCDCPGLVFPSTVPKEFQILMGSFPIAQVRDPYTTIKFLAERIDFPKLLKLQHPDNDDSWSALDICDGWAAKRGYRTAKAARLDTYRAANSLLRMALEGKICLYAYPPKWSIEQEIWENHSSIKVVKWIQARNQAEESFSDMSNSSSDAEEDDIAKASEDNSNSENDSSNESDETSKSEETYVASNKFEILTDDV
ncbi:PREDICTED: guanine nucleotide-binding protein-like 1 [Ceratosolen solmsi marchali]|uniref:Guanine nucleotide-binding protein-like 1 n=1 Tax=Ceratosolen solmsi marchali TaxID=326594 RepID=A0AAJ6YUB3_9HYME|nr:PREDICTED: guanine nucleotide-binding protein-like 1 [Ceratosolen solmsi marchali]